MAVTRPAETAHWMMQSLSLIHIYLRNAAHLYDIGRIGIPDSILNKPTRLTEEEYAVIKEHTIIGAEILKNITPVSYTHLITKDILKR